MMPTQQVQHQFKSPTIRRFSLAQFVKCATSLSAGRTGPDFVRFAISGNNDDTQAVVDPLRDSSVGHDHPLSVRRDLVALFGIDRDIVVHAPITIFFFDKTSFIEDIQVRMQFHKGIHGYDVSVHKIPNIRIGKWNDANTLFALLPGLYDDSRTSTRLTYLELRDFFEKGYWPATHELMGAEVRDWPTDSLNGPSEPDLDVIPPFKVMPQLCIAEFANAIRRHLRSNNVPWSDDVCILHHVKPMTTIPTSRSTHEPTRTYASDAYSDFLADSGISERQLTHGNWYIDVGLEISSDRGECLAWKTESHASLVAAILRIGHDQGIRATTFGDDRYTRQITSHMPALSGFFLKPGVRYEGYFEARHLCLSITDQVVSTQEKKDCYITGADFISGEKARTALNCLYDKYRMATISGSTTARIVMRVPVKHAFECLLHISVNHSVLQESLVSFPRSVWWSFHAIRVLAFSSILTYQRRAPAPYRIQHSALLLSAAAPWFINSLHSPPDLSLPNRDLLNAILLHVLQQDADPKYLLFLRNIPPSDDVSFSDSESDSYSTELSDTDRVNHGGITLIRTLPSKAPPTVPSGEYGILFTRDVRVGPEFVIPRLKSQRLFIKKDTFYLIFSKTFDQLYHDLSGRPTKRIRLDPQQSKVDGASEEGSDSSSEAGSEEYRSSDDESPVHAVSIENEIDLIWRQLIVDIIQLIPNNPRALGWKSFSSLTAAQRALVNEVTYMNHELSDIWFEVQWAMATKLDHDFNFNFLFPARRDQVPSTRLYQSYQRYLSLIHKVGPRTAEAIRSELRKRYDGLWWVPQATATSIWDVEWDPGCTRAGHGDLEDAAPKIYVRSRPMWQGTELEEQ